MVSELLQVLSRPPPPGDLRGCQQPLARTRRGPSRGFLAERCRHAPRRRSPVLRRRPRNCLAHGKQRPAAAGTGRPRHPRRAAMKIDTGPASATPIEDARLTNGREMAEPRNFNRVGRRQGRRHGGVGTHPVGRLALGRFQDSLGGGIPSPGTVSFN